MESTDPRYLKLELDVAHYKQGGGDPVATVRKYPQPACVSAYKGCRKLDSGRQLTAPYRFIELGRGKVDLPAVFRALKEVKFRGWAIVELDSVPDKTRTPKESAIINKRYLQEKLGRSFRLRVSAVRR